MLQFETIKNPHIYIIGAGGTGGFAVEYLTRLFSDSSQRVTIELYDGDILEIKNLKRQNFTMDELDVKKSTALINRLTNNVPEPPVFVDHPEYIVDKDAFMMDLMINTEDDETAIVVLAVDNIATRRLINAAVAEVSDTLPLIVIDSGNHDQGGQVVLYANHPVTYKNMLGKEALVSLPTMLELYPEIDIINSDADENPGLVENCAENAESKPQAMMANVKNAEIIASLIHQLAQNQPVKDNVYTSDIITHTTKGEYHVR